MRLSARRFVVCLYLLFCVSLSFLSYRQRFGRANTETRPNFWPTTRTPPPPAETLLFPSAENANSDRVIDQLNFVPDVMRARPVVIFAAGGAGWGAVGEGRTEFDKAGCLVNNCRLTFDRRKRREADAVVFRQDISDVAGRPPNQIWILYLLESPNHSPSYAKYKQQINWTATYRWDSDIVTPYERFTSNRDVPDDQIVPPITRRTNYAEGKTKKAAWFVSNCQTINRREVYAEQLAKHIDVDMFGSCGDRRLNCRKGTKACDDMLNRDYKFYLSFENSNCLDYITEKYFGQGLMHDVIPIVMGAPRGHYERASPAHSFIHVSEFASPAALAAYLHYLDANDTAYNEYFAWRGSGQFVNTKFWCRLCALLQQPHAKVYADLDDWWRPNHVCQNIDNL